MADRPYTWVRVREPCGKVYATQDGAPSLPLTRVTHAAAGIRYHKLGWFDIQVRRNLAAELCYERCADSR